jgi:ribosomal protein S18 acetylase RimI-like enzyme
MTVLSFPSDRPEIANHMHDFVPVQQLGKRDSVAAAHLIYQSFSEFYDLLPVAPDDRPSIIASQFLTKNSEISGAVAVVENGSVLGVFSGFPAKNLGAAQIVSISGFDRILSSNQRPVFRRALISFRGEIPSVPPDSFYLARIAVIRKLRGSGLAAEILKRFKAGCQNYPQCSLHARSDNSRAIRFYEKNGFSILRQQPPKNYLAMATRE